MSVSERGGVRDRERVSVSDRGGGSPGLAAPQREAVTLAPFSHIKSVNQFAVEKCYLVL